MSNNEQIKCPNCGTNIDVTNILSHQLEAELQAKFQAQLQSERSKMNEAVEKLRDEKLAFEENKKRDERKRILFRENNAFLIEVREGFDFELLCEEIKSCMKVW